MTARDIQRRMLVERYRVNFAMPNYTPRGWWECDVFEITKAGYFVEYEIKLSRSDFKADALKQKEEWVPRNGWGFDRRPGQKKHELIPQGLPVGPSRFWFVTPQGLLDPKEVPPWAGLIECHMTNHSPPFAVRDAMVIKAPTLHRHKLDPTVRQHANGICYYRMHSLFLHGKIEPEAAV
jgi:hypothetical protein